MMEHSSDSDHYVSHPPRVGRKIEHLTNTLQDTTKNLKSLGKLMQTYREVGMKTATAIQRVHSAEGRSRSGGYYSDTMGRNYGGSVDGINGFQRRGISPLRTQQHTDDFVVHPRSGLIATGAAVYEPNMDQWRRGGGGNVRFAGGGATSGAGSMEEVHQLHQTIRHLASQQSRLQDQVDRIGKPKENSPLKDFVDHIRTAHLPPSPESRSPLPRTPGYSYQRQLSAERQQVSTALRSALDKYHSEGKPRNETLEVSELTTKMAHLESAKSTAQADAETTRRRLDQEESSRLTLLKQLDECRRELSSVGQEKSRLSAKVQELESWSERARRKLEDAEVNKQERHKLETEIHELRSKIGQSVSHNDVEDLRRVADKLERQRDQLSEQVNRLTKELEAKERQVTRLLDETREIQTRADMSERSRDESLARSAQLDRELRDTLRKTEVEGERADRVERQLREAHGERDAERVSSDDVIKQWKTRCAHYQKEVTRQSDLVAEQTRRSEILSRDLDASQSQISSLQIQGDSLRLEMEEVLRCRAKDEEMARRRDDDNEEIRLVNYELTAKLESAHKMAEKFKFEVEALGHELNVVREEKARFEERVSASEAGQCVSSDQLSKVTEQLRIITKQKEVLADEFNEARILLQQNHNYESQIKSLTRTIQDLKEAERITVKGLQKKLAKMEHKLKSEVDQLSTKLAEEQKAGQLLLERCELQSTEITRLCEDQWKRDQEISDLQKKLEKMRKREIEKNISIDELTGRLQETTEGLKSANQTLASTVQERDRVMRAVTLEVDSLVDMVASGSAFMQPDPRSGNHPDTAYLRAAVLLPGGLDLSVPTFPDTTGGLNPSRWGADLEAKLAWMRTELETTVSRQKSLKAALEVGSEEVKTLEMNRYERDRVEQELRNTIHSLEKRLELEKSERTRRNLDVLDAQTTFETSKLKEKSEKEAKSVYDRCNKLQYTLDAVRKDLSDADSSDRSDYVKPISPVSLPRIHNLRSEGFSSKERATRESRY